MYFSPLRSYLLAAFHFFYSGKKLNEITPRELPLVF